MKVAGREVHCVTWGTTPPSNGGGARGPVVLVHGLGASTVSWELVGAELAARLETTVTALDLGGFGRTRLPAGSRATLGANGRLVRDLLDEHVGPAVIVGNSMGGAIGVGLAARHPELVRALVLVDPALPRHGPGPRPPWRSLVNYGIVMVPAFGARVAAYRARRLGAERLVDVSLSYSLAYPERLDPALRERLVALATERGTYPEAPAAYADAVRSMLVYLQRRMDADLASLASPTLLVHGELDRLVPVAAARAAVQRHPHLDLLVLDDCGHAPQLDAPERLLAAVVPWVAAATRPPVGAETT